MPIIKRDNYEEFFINYLDGNLSKKEVDELLSFLMANPDLKEEFDELEKGFMIPEEVSYSGKMSLKKQSFLGNLESDNFDELCIASIENNLSSKDQNEFDLMIEDNSELKKQYLLFEKTILSPELTIVFEKKSKLKKAVFVPSSKQIYRYLSIAASIVLLMTLALFIPKNLQEDSLTNRSLSSVQPKKLENNQLEQIKDNPVLQLVAKNESIEVVSKRNNDIIKSDHSNETIIEDELQSEVLPKESIEPLEAAFTKINFSSPTLPQLQYTKPFPANNLVLADNNSQSIKDYLVKKVKKNVFKNELEKNKINSWDVAEFAINGVNKIAGTNMSLNKKLDSEGKVKEIEFSSRLIAFTTPVKE